MSRGVLGFLQANELIIFIALTLAQLVVVVLLCRYTAALNKMRKMYQNLLHYNSGQNLDELLNQLGERVFKNEESIANIDKNLNKVEEQGKCHFQKWALLRYKAFSNTGGDQSFSLALLDADDNGVVLSSIYGRDDSRVYAKSVQQGKSSYVLSEEEAKVLRQAMER